MAVTRANKIIICDTEAERNLDWKEGQLIWTKDTQKLWIIDGGAFVLTAASALVGYQLLIAGAVNGDIVITDGTGQTQDSGKTFSTDGTLAANSDNLIPTQKAVKTYVDDKIVDYDHVDNSLQLAVVNSLKTMYNY
jgi:hypothetical protein